MADVFNEATNMDNLPTPPRITDTQKPSPAIAQTYVDSRGSPHSIDYETNNHDRMVTPSRELRTAGHGRSSSPRPKSASPSEYLLKTTAARVSDGNVLEHRRASIHMQEIAKANSAKKAAHAPPPSERLLKTTVARLADVQAWQQTRGVIKHEQDIWWERRKPLQDASKTNAQLKVESRLLEPTTSHIYSQRKKYPMRTTPDKHIVPGSAEKSPIANSSPLHVSKIPDSSALLRPTFNSQVKNVKNQAVPPPPPAMELPSHLTGPQNVPSRLFAQTTSTRSAKWKSKEELLAAEAAEAAKAAAAAKRIKVPSEHLITYNTSMRHAARTKASTVIPDKREAGWNRDTKKAIIPSVEEVPPLPGQRLGGSPLRRRSDNDFSHSFNSSQEGQNQHEHQEEEGDAQHWQEEHHEHNGYHDDGEVHEEHGENAHEEHGENVHEEEDEEVYEYKENEDSMEVDASAPPTAAAANGLNGELADSGLMDAQPEHEEEGDFESF